jgi:hypothetical protein
MGVSGGLGSLSCHVHLRGNTGSGVILVCTFFRMFDILAWSAGLWCLSMCIGTLVV